MDDNRNYLLLDMYSKLPNSKDVLFDIISPVNMLSENATIEDWNKIVHSIKSKDISEYKGIIITHGTDTISYFANALTYMLNNVELPILIVSSNFEITNEKSNGLDNFKTAVDFILNEGTRGVFVAYKNSDGIVYIHNGESVKQITELTDNVYSINNEYFAKIENEKIVKNIEIRKHKVVSQNIEFKPKLDGILYIKPIPSQNYDFNLDNYKIVYHEMFHSGTIPKQAISFIKKCKEKDILFFMDTKKKAIEGLYAPTEEAVKNGAIILFDMTQEASIVKLMMANRNF